MYTIENFIFVCADFQWMVKFMSLSLLICILGDDLNRNLISPLRMYVIAFAGYLIAGLKISHICLTSFIFSSQAIKWRRHKEQVSLLNLDVLTPHWCTVILRSPAEKEHIIGTSTMQFYVTYTYLSEPELFAFYLTCWELYVEKTSH